MKIIKSGTAFYLASIFTLSSFAQTPPSPSTLILDSIQRMTPALAECPERVWPQPGWQNYNVFLLDQSSPHSWMWKPESQSLHPIANTQLTAEIFGPLYNFQIINDKPTVMFNVNQTPHKDYIAQTAIHEGFHYLGQAGWKQLHPGSSRSTAYPISGQPRLYRLLIYEKMQAYLQDPDDLHLQEAKYWFEKWKKSEPREAKNYTDNVEGSAEYTGQFASALAELGCKASDQDLIQLAAQNISKRPLHSQGRLDAFQSESYRIGSTALLIGKLKGLQSLEWTRQMALGHSSIELLFKDIEALPQNHPRILTMNFAQRARKASASYDSALKSPIQNWKSKDFIRVAVPFDWLAGSFKVLGFFYAKEISTDLMIMAETDFNKSEDPSYIKILTNAAVFTKPSACGQSFILVHQDKIQETSPGRYEFTNQQSTGQIRGKMTKDENELQWLCTEN